MCVRLCMTSSRENRVPRPMSHLRYVREELSRVKVGHEVGLGADERVEVGGLVVRPYHESDDTPHGNHPVVALPAGPFLERPHLIWTTSIKRFSVARRSSYQQKSLVNDNNQQQQQQQRQQ